jgi:hypothetical protein
MTTMEVTSMVSVNRKNLPPYTLAGFDLTTLNSARESVTT